MCGKTIRVGEVKVGCLDCQLRCHLQCLAPCELYSALQHKDYIQEDRKSALNSAIPIRCVACVKKCRGEKIACALNPLDYDTFYVPVKLADHMDLEKIEDKHPRSDDEMDGPALGKRGTPGESVEFHQVTKMTLESTLQNQLINDYISVNVLIELQNHGRSISFLKEELTYEISRSVLDKYKGFACTCGVSCAFSCAYCHLNRTHHRVCLEKLEIVSDFSLKCIDCFPKNSRRGKKAEPVKFKEIEEEPAIKVKEQKSKTIRFRKSQNILLQLLDGVTSCFSSKKMTFDVLK